VQEIKGQEHKTGSFAGGSGVRKPGEVTRYYYFKKLNIFPIAKV
jgi:hypothetical protein